MTRASVAWEALQAELRYSTPNCENDPRFIDDTTPAPVLAPICADCPVFALCAAYAAIERPPAGVWAGVRRTTSIADLDLVWGSY